MQSVIRKINNLSTFSDSTLEYVKFGSGPACLLAFHGFGRSYSDFEFLAKHLGDHFTIFAFNIFHHGNSTYPSHRVDKNTLQKDEIGTIIESFLEQESIDRFSILGYSLGGKMALTICEYFAPKMDHLILVAPDGIHINKWYKFAAHNRIGRGIAKGIIKKPRPFFRFADFMKWSKLVPPHLHRFAYINLDTEEKRRLVYTVWMTFRQIDPDIHKVQRMLNENKVNAILVFGKFDRVIPPRVGERLASGLDEKDCLHVMDNGHKLLNDDLGELLRKQLGL